MIEVALLVDGDRHGDGFGRVELVQAEHIYQLAECEGRDLLWW
jgi:hypothetical protein